jgi:ADP-heptose:LPS heptosyltransferase
MGDVILTTPLLRVLRRRHPEAHLVYCTGPRSRRWWPTIQRSTT